MSKKTPNSFIQAKQELKERIASGQPEPVAPRSLYWHQIEVIPEVFQQRYPDVDASTQHIQTLARAIKEGPRGAHQDALAPVIIFWAGDRWVCVDGHHRLIAYKYVGHKRRVPVKALRGATLDEAVKVSLGENSKDKLPMSKRCKTEAAWRLTLGETFSKAEIARLAGVDESTIANMRRRIRDVKEKYPNVDLGEFTWGQARFLKPEDLQNGESDLIQRQAAKLCRAIEKAGKKASAVVWCHALEMLSPGLVAEVSRHYHQLQQSVQESIDPFAFIPEEPEENPDF